MQRRVVGRHDRRAEHVSRRVRLADLEQVLSTEPAGPRDDVPLAAPEIEQRHVLDRGVGDLRPVGVVDELGDDASDRDVLIVVHRRLRLVVVVVLDVLDRVVVDVPAGRDEEAHERRSVPQIPPIAGLVLDGSRPMAGRPRPERRGHTASHRRRSDRRASSVGAPWHRRRSPGSRPGSIPRRAVPRVRGRERATSRCDPSG